MRRILFVAALLLTTQVEGQRVNFVSNAKSDAVSQVKLDQLAQQKSGASEVRLLAKVSAQYNADKLKAYGIVTGAKAGDIVTLRVPIDKLQIIDNYAEILQYCISPRVAPEMNRTRVDTRTDSVQAGLGLPQAYTGKDVIIGITDWGFDYKHPNFNNNGQNNHRLLRAWDQFRLKGPAPQGYDYGTEIVGRRDLLAAQGDTSGLYGYATHGTHVAGICAGRGIDGEYVGQAPYANLLFASFRLDLASWLDAVGWMKNVAKEEGKRLVINNSWGMYTLGPIDGTSLASQAINNLSDSGIVFVTSGGNCGDDLFHLSKTFVAGQNDTLRSIAKYYNYTEIGQDIVIWGEPGNLFSFSFAMVGNGDSVCLPWQYMTMATPGGNGYSYTLDSALVAGTDTIRFRMTVESANIFNSRPHVLLTVYKNANYAIHLAVTAHEGTVHLWNLADLANGAGNMGAEFSKSYYPNYTRGDNASGIGEPACAEKCITVAAHNSDGKKPGGEIVPGVIASFSSHGPVIDGRRKPDLSAPGLNVTSSISSYTTEVYSPVMTYTYAGREYVWARMSGTSMSGPAITGIVALMLEANPQLSPVHIREILCATTRNDSQTGPLHERDSISDIWGWGKVNALAAVNEALAHVDIREADEDWFAKSLQVYPNPARDRITVMTGRHTPETVAIYSTAGTHVLSQQVVMEAQIDISGLPHGVYIVKCGARNTRLVK